MKKYSHFKKPVVLSVLVALLLVTVGFFIYRNHTVKISPQVSQSGPTPEQTQQEVDSNASAKKKFVEENTSSQSPNPQTNQPSSSNINITGRQETDGSVTVFTKLTGFSNGTCALLVTNGSQQTSQTANIIYQPEYSSCAGFSVPISAAGTGTWTIKLTIASSGQSTSNSITFEVK